MLYFRGVETVRRANAALLGSLPHGIIEADVAGESHLRGVPAMYLKVPKSSDIDQTAWEKPPVHQCYAHVDVRRAVRNFRDVKYQRTHTVVMMFGEISTL